MTPPVMAIFAKSLVTKQTALYYITPTFITPNMLAHDNLDLVPSVAAMQMANSPYRFPCWHSDHAHTPFVQPS